MKHIVITGANRGLGLEFCRQYLADGDRVTATCRLPESATELLHLQQKHKTQLSIIPLDVTKKSMICTLSQQINGPIDILINNAGIAGPRGVNLGNMDSNIWMQVFHTNTIAPLMICQALLTYIQQGMTKKIVFITSKMGSISDNKSGGSYIYRSSKSALNAAAKSLALELEEQDIYVGILHPGWVRTDMGGPQGLIDVSISISAMKKNIEELNSETSGRFFNYDGTENLW